MVTQITFPPHPHDARFELQQEILTVAKRIERAPSCRVFRRLCERTVEPVFPVQVAGKCVHTDTANNNVPSERDSDVITGGGPPR